MPGRGTVGFPAYRSYESARERANDAMMVLLVSSRLSSHSLSLHSGSTVQLPELFPRVPDIKRMNRTPDAVINLISHTERDLTYMAIPYVLSIHQTLIADCLRLLQKAEAHQDNREPGLIDLEELHDLFQSETGATLPSTEMKLFHFIRMIRNRIVHNSATTGSYLRNYFRQLDGNAQRLWEQLSGRSFAQTKDPEQLDLGAGELIATLAISARLARAANRSLQSALPRDSWIDLIINDFLETHEAGQQRTRARRIANYARHMYGTLNITAEELNTRLS